MKNFNVNTKTNIQENSRIIGIKYHCVSSPYLDCKDIKATQSCPFHLIYRWSEDEEEFYLSSYDEMHNHLLVEEP